MTDQNGNGSGAAIYLRQSVSEALDTAAAVIDQTLRERRLHPGDGKRLLDALRQSPWFDKFCAKVSAGYEHRMADHTQVAKRKDLFRRVLVHPIGPLLDSGQFDRALLPNYFAFFKHLLGDGKDVFTAECEAVAAELAATHGADYGLDAFYDHPRIKAILYQIWVRIVRSFQRFEMRRQWFIDLMSFDPSSEPVSAHFYIERKHTPDEVHRFTGRNFYELFNTLFAAARHLSPEEAQLFERTVGSPPDKVLGPFLKELDHHMIDD